MRRFLKDNAEKEKISNVKIREKMEPNRKREADDHEKMEVETSYLREAAVPPRASEMEMEVSDFKEELDTSKKDMEAEFRLRDEKLREVQHSTSEQLNFVKLNLEEKMVRGHFALKKELVDGLSLKLVQEVKDKMDKHENELFDLNLRFEKALREFSTKVDEKLINDSLEALKGKMEMQFTEMSGKISSMEVGLKELTEAGIGDFESLEARVMRVVETRLELFPRVTWHDLDDLTEGWQEALDARSLQIWQDVRQLLELRQGKVSSSNTEKSNEKFLEELNDGVKRPNDLVKDEGGKRKKKKR